MEFVPVLMGNPHSVSFVPDVQKLDLNRIGPPAETHPSFPKASERSLGANHLAERSAHLQSGKEAAAFTWACGNGASGVIAACLATGRTERKVLVHLLGGDLNIEWRESDNNVNMTGPATEVFSGEWNG